MKTQVHWPRISIEVEREEISIDAMHWIKVPDEGWRFVDKAGHGHFWRGKKVPTCKSVQVGTQWIGDEYDAEEVPIMELQCKICAETIEPGYRTQAGPTHVPGPTWITLTINDETFRLTPEQYALSVDAWRDIVESLQ